jgi:hypothetical protein
MTLTADTTRGSEMRLDIDYPVGRRSVSRAWSIPLFRNGCRLMDTPSPSRVRHQRVEQVPTSSGISALVDAYEVVVSSDARLTVRVTRTRTPVTGLGPELEVHQAAGRTTCRVAHLTFTGLRHNGVNDVHPRAERESGAGLVRP